jgi:hypothetical protein
MKEIGFHKFVLLKYVSTVFHNVGTDKLVLNRELTFVKDETFKHTCDCRVSFY